MAISHYYWHLWSAMAISHLYWYLVVKKGFFILLLTYNGQEWQFHIATDIKWSRMSISSWSFVSIYRNERALLSKSKIWQTNLLWPMSPPFETPWQKTDSYMFPYHQWKPIQNGQLIRKYKKIPVQWQIDRYIETNTQLDTIGRWTPQSSKQRFLPYHYTNYWTYCTYKYQRQMDPLVKQAEMPVIPLHQLLDLLHI